MPKTSSHQSNVKPVLVTLALLTGFLLIIPSGLVFAKSAAPTLAVLSPSGLFNPSSTVPQSFVVAFAVTNFEIVQPGLVNQTNVSNQGHLLVFLDDNFYGDWTTANPVPFYGLSPGNHTIMLQLVNNDYSALNPDVTQAINVSVQAPPQIFDFQSILQAAQSASSAANAATSAATAAGATAAAAKASADSANSALGSLASTVQGMASSLSSLQSTANSFTSYALAVIAMSVIILLLVLYVAIRRR